jgi:hypothetical protein
MQAALSEALTLMAGAACSSADAAVAPAKRNKPTNKACRKYIGVLPAEVKVSRILNVPAVVRFHETAIKVLIPAT